jgi:hypothetical protein
MRISIKAKPRPIGVIGSDALINNLFFLETTIGTHFDNDCTDDFPFDAKCSHNLIPFRLNQVVFSFVGLSFICF